MSSMVPAAGAPALAVVVVLEEHPQQPTALHIIGWAERAEGGWEAVVALGTGVAQRMSALPEHGVREVLGAGPVPSGPPNGSPVGGLVVAGAVPPALAR